ncbi:MAG: hypothetical protein VX768_02320 [Planctomycetota bacterium]|nr:hypothetical protein [Planctomycetota bacterium]
MVSVVLFVTTCSGLTAEDELAITELYGQAVHAYFDGSYEEAHKNLTGAIELGTDDPRVYYFRGLAKMKLGRAEEAGKDFEEGGRLEAQGAAQFYPIGRSLERIQGSERAMIEKIRKQARIQIRLREKKIEAARLEAFKRDEKLRNSGKPVKLGDPSESAKSDEDPFGTSGAAKAPANKTPDPAEQPAEKKPAGNADPFAEPEKKPAGNADPFAEPEKKPAGNADPFAEPEKKPAGNADPFAEPEKKPAGNSDPFSEKSGTGSNGQQAQVGLRVNVGQLMKDEAVAAMLAAQPGVPGFVTKWMDMQLHVQLPDNLMAEPSEYNFHAKLTFADATSAQAAFTELFNNAPAEDFSQGGKTYKLIAAPDAPKVYVLQEGGSIDAYSEAFLKSGAPGQGTANLQAAMKAAPAGEPFKMAVDIAGAKQFLSTLSLLAPQVESLIESDSLTVAGGGNDELMMMLAINAPDESTAKKVKQTLTLGVAAAAGALATQMPDENVAPATNEFMNHVMTQLTPKQSGNSVKIVINKPDNYDELKLKMPAEAEKIQAELMKNLGPAAGCPGGGFPDGGPGDDPFGN